MGSAADSIFVLDTPTSLNRFRALPLLELVEYEPRLTPGLLTNALAAITMLWRVDPFDSCALSFSVLSWCLS
jgi:hypothetical protein